MQPEGWRRQDDLDHQPRRGARRVRPAGAAGRLRSAGRAVGRPRRRAAPARPHRLQPADGARRRRSRTSSARPACRAWICCRATSTCRRPRSSWSARSAREQTLAGRWRRCCRSTTTCSSTASPRLGLLTVNALTAAHGVIIPLECEFFSLRGVALLIDTIEKVRERLNPDLAARRHPGHDVRRPHAARPRGVRPGASRRSATRSSTPSSPGPSGSPRPPSRASRSPPGRRLGRGHGLPQPRPRGARPHRPRRLTSAIAAVEPGGPRAPAGPRRPEPRSIAAAAGRRRGSSRRRSRCASQLRGPVRPAADPDQQPPARRHRGRAVAGHRRVPGLPARAAGADGWTSAG